MRSKIPWSERINMLSINPEAATIRDIAQMAADLNDKDIKLGKIRTLAENELANGRNNMVKTLIKIFELSGENNA